MVALAELLVTGYRGTFITQDIDKAGREKVKAIVEALIKELKIEDKSPAEIFNTVIERLAQDPTLRHRILALRPVVQEHINELVRSSLYNNPAILKDQAAVAGRLASVVITEKGALNNPGFAKGVEEVMNAGGNVSFVYGDDFREEGLKKALKQKVAKTLIK